MPVKDFSAIRIFLFGRIQSWRLIEALAQSFQLVFPLSFLFCRLSALRYVSLRQFAVSLGTVPRRTFGVAGNTLVFSRFKRRNCHIALISFSFPVSDFNRITRFQSNIHQLAARKRPEAHTYTLLTDSAYSLFSGSFCDQTVSGNAENISFFSIQVLIYFIIRLIFRIFRHPYASDHNLINVNRQSICTADLSKCLRR